MSRDEADWDEAMRIAKAILEPGEFEIENKIAFALLAAREDARAEERKRCVKQLKCHCDITVACGICGYSPIEGIESGGE